MSSLLAAGYSDAPDYPVAFVWEEIQHVVERQNQMLASEASLMKAAISTGVAAFGKDGGKDAHGHFSKLIKRLVGGAGPEPEKRSMADKVKKDRESNGR